MFVDGKYQVPSRCTSNSCRSRSFRPLRSTAVTQDWQIIKSFLLDFNYLFRLQEFGETDSVDAGRIPRTLEIHLFGDLVDGVTPGELVTITGIVKVGVCVCV